MAKEERISSNDLLEFMQTHQKTKLSLEELSFHMRYFDPTADEKSLSVQGIIIEDQNNWMVWPARIQHKTFTE